MELDELKSAWKSVPNEKTYNKNDIFEMMKKKSSSTIKWLFIFTLTEFLVVLAFSVSSIFKSKMLATSIDLNDIPSYYNYMIGSLITIILTIIFLIIIYKTYKKIDINNSIIGLTNQIIKFRKTVNLFIATILISLIIISIPYYFNLGRELYINKIGNAFDPSKATLIGYISVAIAILFLIAITAIYYSIIHFLFLKKLAHNIKDLKEID